MVEEKKLSLYILSSLFFLLGFLTGRASVMLGPTGCCILWRGERLSPLAWRTTEVIGQQKWRCSLFLVRGLLEDLLIGGGVVREGSC